ncbi:restriction endonuclease PLD domain-containing protein [Paenibacillus sp. GP183]|uniref:restriction endonuclease PLD domain-containing protein n=1 Tax=Paenibacillus sp. GP183 TaxID=1882751 RepID=UPI000897FA80|nr:restriction endonuclease PLD domain-containing protein [Paenibacillus sp. GP183]SED14842.1 NgoFVII restriction endonuclease [Paenibacillus sp. GP183]
MPVYPKLYQEVIEDQYQRGLRRLDILTGYASSSFVHHLIYRYEDLRLDVILGMAKQDAISIWDHNEYVNLSRSTGRLRVRYYNGRVPIHSKIFLWLDRNSVPQSAYAGSANLSWHGFRDYQELLVTADDAEVRSAFPADHELIDCTSEDVFQHFTMSFQESPQSSQIDAGAVHHIVGDRPWIELPIVTIRSGEVHEKSGLNWGQRPGREPNQAYIPIPSAVHKEYPGFLPDRKRAFNLITDDGESFVCVVAQDNSKALESSHDNSILGKYFRKRLGLPFGSKVEKIHLDSYGRSNVRLYKIDDETFYLDFSEGRL